VRAIGAASLFLSGGLGRSAHITHYISRRRLFRAVHSRGQR
jgi:hypothetical protein